MGTTLDAINSRSGVRLLYTAVIEGYPNVLTNDDPAVAILAYSESNAAAYSDDFTVALGGLTIDWDTNQSYTPMKPFPSPTIVRLSVVPSTTSAAPSTVSDTFGETVFKRVPAQHSELRANVDCNDTSITVARADDFAASGTLYLGGLEAVAYSSRDTGTDVFTVSTRGKYPAVLTSSADRWARTVKPLTATEQDMGVSPLVTSEPTAWVGRWVAIWVHRVVGGVPDTVEEDQSSAHCMFVGTIASVGESDTGATVIEALDVRQKIYGTRLLRDQFRAKVAEGVTLAVGMEFGIHTERTSNTTDTVGTGNPLVVVAGAPGSVNEVQAGRYSAVELGEKISAWLQGERAASRILFNLSYQAVWSTADGSRGRLSLVDPTSGAGPRRLAALTFPDAHVSRWLGWAGDDAFGSFSIASWAITSPAVPLRFRLDPASFQGTDIALTEARGEWISQAAYLPASLRDVAAGFDGIVKFGSLGYARAKYTSETAMSVSGSGCDAWFPGTGDITDSAGRQYTVDDEVDLDITQILVMEGAAPNIMLRLLLSTGTANFNSASYDNLEESASCVVPFSALGQGFIDEAVSLFGTGSFCAIVREPTSFHQLFEADFILRRAFLVWAGGRLRIKSWATPSSTYASFALDETSKAAPSGTQDNGRSAASEQADYYNLITIRFNVDADGNYKDAIILKDADSIRAHGERGFEIKARNTFRQVGAIGSPIDDLVSEYAGFFHMTSRPWTVIRRSIDQNYLEQAYPGVVLTLTDKFIRNRETGKRYDNRTGTGGLSGYPGMVIGHRITLGGPQLGGDPEFPGGEIDVMISPQRTLPVYVPCAHVDDTAASAGYNAGTKVLTCYAHEHSESSEVADATRFVATDKVLVIQIDPDTAAAAQKWSDTVASQTGNTITLTTGLAGYDTSGATRYRVIFDAYGTVTSTQKAKAYQADDADGMIVDTAQSYGFGFFGASQSTTVTLSVASSLPARYATDAYGDGKAFDVGYERDAVRLANNLIHYKTSPQQPTIYSEVRDFTGAGTWQLVEVMPFFVGRGEFTGGRTRPLSVAPRIRSTSGATAEVRITAARRMPSDANRDDVTRIGPYTEATFTTTSTTASVSTAQTLDISHIRLGDQLLGGVVFLYVEIKTATEYTGLARCVVGALS